MKISNNLKTGITAGSQIQLNPLQPNIPLTDPFASTAQKKLEDELSKIDSQFDLYGVNAYELPKSIDYTEMSYTPLTDGEIKKYSEDLLTEYKLSNIKQINESAANNAASLTTSKGSAETAAQKKQAEIESIYSSAKQDSSNDALRRGLARSSIVINKLNALESAKAQAKADTAQSLFDSIAEIDDKISGLEAKRLDALNEFDILYAAKLGAEIEKQKEERQGRLDEVIKYNNSLKSSNADYGLDYAKTDSALNNDLYEKNADIAQNDLISKIQQTVYEQKYTVVSEYLYNMTATDALKDLEDRKSFYLEQLGKAGYDKMLVEQKSRK